MYGFRVVVVAPSKTCWGMARPLQFPVETSETIELLGNRTTIPIAGLGWVYLSADLEAQEDAIITAVVAHELAHLVVGDISGAGSERKADALIREWGFSTKLDRLCEINPHHRY